MERACLFACEWEEGLVLSINVSVGQLEAPTFLKDTFRVLEKTGFPARCLQIEMTENIFMEPDAAFRAPGFPLRSTISARASHRSDICASSRSRKSSWTVCSSETCCVSPGQPPSCVLW